MSTLVNQLQKLAHNYVRRGGKANRRQQLGRMIKFLQFIEVTERPNNLHEVGARHVVSFWKANRTMAAKTAHGYWLALCEMWRLAQKKGTPPKPFQLQKANALQQKLPSGQQEFLDLAAIQLPSMIEIGRVLSACRISHSMSLEDLSIFTGLLSAAIEAIEAGDHVCRYEDVSKLYDFFHHHSQE